MSEVIKRILKKILGIKSPSKVMIDPYGRAFNLNTKYLASVHYAIKEKERQLGRYLTGEEQQEIFTQIKKDFYDEK